MAKKIDAYCMKCRKNVPVKDSKEDVVRGRNAYVGKCPECGGPVMVYKDDWDYENSPKKKCPKCASELLAEVKVCKYCKFDYEAETEATEEKAKSVGTGPKKKR